MPPSSAAPKQPPTPQNSKAAQETPLIEKAATISAKTDLTEADVFGDATCDGESFAIDNCADADFAEKESREPQCEAEQTQELCV